MVEEFFELFKTPWQPASPARRYRVALCTRGRESEVDADVVIVYSTGREAIDAACGVDVEEQPAGDLTWNGVRLPLHHEVACFSGETGAPMLTLGERPVGYRGTSSHRTIWRIGYDLFREVATLLASGQAPANALVPTLELHIDLLRHMMTASRVSFVEIPAHPHGRDFICCLTHDVDFYGIRRHKLDRTLAGFALRASIGSFVDVLRGRRTVREAAQNFRSVLSLPLVFAGWARDFWSPLHDYGIADGARPSTFFIVPFKHRAGVSPEGGVAAGRAVAYDVTDVPGDDVREQLARGAEITVHGIDAWHGEHEGREERARVATVTGQPTGGIRMHWLYFSSESPRHLEAAGYRYDSTCGYNDAVGYRAGTAQVFRLAGTAGLMELPITIMDTAMFYPSRMGLSPNAALAQCRQIISNTKQFGGALVINWHDRSLAPERLWNRFYEQLLGEVDGAGSVWFATADQAVRWFRRRRAIRFSESGRGFAVTGDVDREALPPMAIRTWKPVGPEMSFEDRPFDARGDEAIDLDREPAFVHQLAN